jgi:ATP-dependent Lon protease
LTKRSNDTPLNDSKAGDGASRGEPAIPDVIPVFPLKDIVAFPFMMFPLLANEPHLVELADEALAGNKVIGLFTVPPDEKETPGIRKMIVAPEKRDGLGVYPIGTVAVIHKMLRLPDGAMRLLVQGTSRVRIDAMKQEKPFARARVTPLEEVVESDLKLEAQARNMKELFGRVVDGSNTLPDELKVIAINIEEPGRLADFVAANLNLNIPAKQIILETVNTRRRMDLVTAHLLHELNLQAMHKKIQSEVQSEIDKSQRDYILRQQIRAIQKELGESEESPTELKELEQRIAEADLPEAALSAATKELDRLRRMSPAAAEYTVSRTFLDWILNVPWKPVKRKPIDIRRAEAVLNEDHYDLERVKERILEYLAVRKLKDKPRSPILCLVGPPGVGKTSLGKSIARALDRPFTRLSLGGVHDEAEIRGHRRTYVGSMPGRIVLGLVAAKAADPVFMLDEIDKVGMSYRGDPTSALLEVLDPEQNSAFSDHYLNIPLDLSQVIFVTTANVLDTIPPPLRDRMEVIELYGYTAQDKLYIAKNYLVPRALDENGIRRKHLTISDSGLRKIIQSYTMEAGVRNLEREINRVARKVATRVARRASRLVRVTDKNVSEFLGPEPFFEEKSGRKDAIGVATGMAWTQVGGTILFIEATRMPGSRNLTLTGQLGDVMRESAIAALSYLRTHAARLGIPEEEFNRFDIHIHVPAGAMPKDGPSAGVALFTALASLFSNRPIRRDTAMTGELTLRGQVLPIGGLKQKVLGAHRSGIRRIILPRANVKDLDEIAAEVRKDLTFIPVDDLDQVLLAALPALEMVKKERVTAANSKLAVKPPRARKGKSLPKPAPVRDTDGERRDRAALPAVRTPRK